MKLLIIAYLVAAVAMAIYEMIRLVRVLGRSHIKMKINAGESVDMRRHPLAKIMLGFFAVKGGLLWPWSLYKLIRRSPAEIAEEETGSVAMDAALAVSEDNLPQGEEYVREVKQVHVMLAAEAERALCRGYGHRLVVTDVLLQLAYQAAADELNLGLSSENVDDYVAWSLARVMDGEVDRALGGIGREQTEIRRKRAEPLPIGFDPQAPEKPE